MNKQTNIYRNYIFYHLADGRILASMPKVGDMIFENETEFKAGIKKEEYREIKEYYKKRFGLSDWVYECESAMAATCIDKYDTLVFTLGYPKADDTERRITFKNPRIRIGTGRPEWGAEPGNMYFVISWEEE